MIKPTVKRNGSIIVNEYQWENVARRGCDICATDTTDLLSCDIQLLYSCSSPSEICKQRLKLKMMRAMYFIKVSNYRQLHRKSAPQRLYIKNTVESLYWSSTEHNIWKRVLKITEILASFRSVNSYPAHLREFSKDTIKFLGVQFSIIQFREMSAHNWNRILEKAQARVESYKKRRLSMPGKILLLNVAVFPLFLPGKYFFPRKSVVKHWQLNLYGHLLRSR